MPRPLTKEEEERFLGWSEELGRIIVSLSKASIPEQVRAYNQAEKRILQETRTAFEKQEMRRRIAMDLLRVTSAGPWRGFSPYLRRVERLGYSSMFCRLYTCFWSASASKGSPTGARKTAALIADFERRLRGQKLHPAVREEVDHVLARARNLAGLDTGEETAEERRRYRAR